MATYFLTIAKFLGGNLWNDYPPCTLKAQQRLQQTERVKVGFISGYYPGGANERGHDLKGGQLLLRISMS